MRCRIVRGGNQVCAGRDNAPIFHHDRTKRPASPRTHVFHRALDRLLHVGIAHTALRALRAHPVNCTGKADSAVYSFVMRRIKTTHCHLQLDFDKFACKICASVWCSAENRMSGRVAIAPLAAGIGSTPAAIWKPFISWRGPLEENSRLWLGKARPFVTDCRYYECATQ
jgi:hypothetical protein